MNVTYPFSASGHKAVYKLGRMILPQLEEHKHSEDAVGMFFFDNNTFILPNGNPIGERFSKHVLTI